jgi:hypothetical protein
VKVKDYVVRKPFELAHGRSLSKPRLFLRPWL